MNILTLLSTVREGLAQSTELDSWCFSAYGKGVSVRGGVDPRNFPRESDCPALAVLPGEKETGPGLEDRIKRDVVVIYCFLADRSSADHPTIPNLTIHTAVDNLEVFRSLAQNAIDDIDLGDAYIERIHTTYEVIEDYPLVRAAMEIWVAEEMTLGCDPLA